MRITTQALACRFAASRNGAVSIIAATFGVCMVASLAISVDVASVYLQKRRDQGALDLAALAAARSLDAAEQSARASLAANGVASPTSLHVLLGRYDPDASVSPALRFQAGATPVNAVRLEMSRPSPIVFGKMFIPEGRVEVSTAATAAATRMASFSIGSRLLSLNEGVANRLLSQLVGAQVSLNAMDYRALAAAQVDMPDFLNALAPRVGASAGTYDSVLATNPPLQDVLHALGDASGVGPGARAPLNRLAALRPAQRVALRRMLGFGPFAELRIGQPTGLSARASVLDMLFTAAEIANGRRQIDLDLGAEIPQLLGLSASLVIGERPQTSPWLSLGREGVSVSTAQARVRLVAEVRGPGALGQLRLPLAIDLASGTATLVATRCGHVPRTEAQVTLEVKPAIADAWVGDPRDIARWFDLGRPVDIGPGAVISVFPITATAFSYIAATNLRPSRLAFSADEIRALKIKTVGTTDAARTTLSSLVRNLSLSVAIAPLGLTLFPSSIGEALEATLTPLGAALDPVIDQLLGALGVGLGEADVTVRGIRCDGAVLVG